MAELKIAEVILRERRKLKMTQEELAGALMVSPQAVSNWERGGYPDITLLPRIANYFKITVDELIGNDEATMSEDMVAFGKKYLSNKFSEEEKLAFAKEMYEKYPNNFELIHYLGDSIVKNMEHIDENIALLKEIHKKIIDECTDEEYRRASIHRMCYAEFTLKAAGALIGSGETDEGFALLEKAFPLYERWNSIPKGTLVDIGNHAAFGKLTVNKFDFAKPIVNIHFEDGHKVWTPYLWLFWQLPNDISRAMTEWPWFDDVKEDTRYVALLARAKEMADGK